MKGLGACSERQGLAPDIRTAPGADTRGCKHAWHEPFCSVLIGICFARCSMHAPRGIWLVFFVDMEVPGYSLLQFPRNLAPEDQGDRKLQQTA